MKLVSLNGRELKVGSRVMADFGGGTACNIVSIDGSNIGIETVRGGADYGAWDHIEPEQIGAKWVVTGEDTCGKCVTTSEYVLAAWFSDENAQFRFHCSLPKSLKAYRTRCAKYKKSRFGVAVSADEPNAKRITEFRKIVEALNK